MTRPGSADHPQEAGLVERLKQGDEQAFEHVVRHYGGRLLAVARRILPEEEEARDAVQEAFVSAFQSIASFRRGALLSTWLHRIVVNAALMRLRASRRAVIEGLEDLLPRFDENGHHVRPGLPWRAAPDEQHLRKELCAGVRRAIDALPSGYRTVLVLRDVEGLATRETAALLGWTENAVKIRLHRARQALRTLLEPVMAAEAAPGRSRPAPAPPAPLARGAAPRPAHA